MTILLTDSEVRKLNIHPTPYLHWFNFDEDLFKPVDAGVWVRDEWVSLYNDYGRKAFSQLAKSVRGLSKKQTLIKTELWIGKMSKR